MKTASIQQTSAIEFNHVSFSYSPEKDIIRDVSLVIKQGETVGLVGANGAGKSTLLKLIVGLMLPTAGSINVNGILLTPKQLKHIRQHVGYAFQEPDNQLFMPTVGEDVGFQARQQGFDDKTVEAIVTKALEQVNGLHLKEMPPYQLSGGEKRLATLATVFASSPDIILLDEPSVGLDPQSRRNLLRILQQRTETKVIATHDMDLAMELCDRILIMYQGKICADDVPSVIFDQEELLFKYSLEKPLSLQRCEQCKHKKETK